MPVLRLYSRPACHLCDYAVLMLKESGVRLELETVNIEEQLGLLVRYNTAIPVFQRIDTGAELCWPFDDDELEMFLEGVR